MKFRILAYSIQTSGYSEWRQAYVISGELVETAKEYASDHPLPYPVAVLAAHLSAVVADPLHFMYEKVNEFLQRGSQWNVRKLPSYWVDKILMKPPSNDESHYREAEWLLDILIDGLRTSAVCTSLVKFDRPSLQVPRTSNCTEAVIFLKDY